MFGDLKGMMDKLQHAKKNIEETKKRLETVYINETGADGNISVSITANLRISDIQINEPYEDREELEDVLVITLNKALARAHAIHEAEIAAAAKDGMPPISGMDMFK